MDTLFLEFFQNTGFYLCDYRNIIMIVIGLVFIYLGISKDYEPLLLVPIGFGMLMGNIPIFKGLGLGIYESNSVLHYLYFGKRPDLNILSLQHKPVLEFHLPGRYLHRRSNVIRER